MTTVSSLQAELSELTHKLIAKLEQFPTASFNTAPAPQCWSAAEVTEHLLIIAKNINQVLRAQGAAPEREVNKKLAMLKAALEDRQTKRTAPESVKPTGSVTEQQALIVALQEQMELLNKVVEEKELSELCTVYPHPVAGRLTRLEWIYFTIYHTERHLLQLEQIKKAVSN